MGEWYSIPLLIAAVISGALSIYTWRQRHTPGARAFAWLMALAAEWSLAEAVGLLSTRPSAKILWTKVAFIGSIGLPLAWLVFTLQYSNRRKWLAPWRLASLAVVPVITLVLTWTNDVHGLIWQRYDFYQVGAALIPNVTYGAWFWVHAGYFGVLIMVGTLFIMRVIVELPSVHRRQGMMVLLGIAIPWVGPLLYVFHLGPLPGTNLTPLAFSLSGLVLALGLFHCHLLDLTPTVRNVIVEGLRDGVIVLDRERRIVALNPAAQRILGLQTESAAGQPLSTVLPPLSDWLDEDLVGEGVQTEIALDHDGARFTYEVQISRLYDQRGHQNVYLIHLRDVTERKRVEEALWESQEKFRCLIEQSYDGIDLVDERGVVIEWNRGAEQITGIKREEALGQFLWELQCSYAPEEGRSPEFRERLKSQFLEIVTTGQTPSLSGSTEYDIQRPDGTRRSVEAVTFPIKTDRGFMVGAFFRDITERKQAQVALERERNLFMAGPVVVLEWGVGENWTVKYVSSNVSQFGYQPEDFTSGRIKYIHILHPEDSKIPASEVKEHFRAGVNFYEQDYRIFTADGSIRWVHDFTAVNRDEQGGIARCDSYIMDITERKWAEEAVLRLSTAVRTTAESVVITDLDGWILEVNEAALNLFGAEDRSEVYGRSLFDFVIPEERQRAIATIVEVLEKGSVSGREFSAVVKDGSVVPVELTGSLMKVADGAPVGYVAVVRDITERKRAEAERQHLLAAEREQRLLAETLAEVALVLTSQTRHEVVLDEILHQVQRLVPFSTANIMLLDSNVLRSARRQGYEAFGAEEFVAQWVHPLEQYPLGAEVVRTRKPLVVPDTRQDPRWVTLAETAWVRACLLVPISLHDRVLGLLRLDSDTTGAFTEKHAECLVPLANAAAIAIENARLVEGLEVEVAARTAEIVTERDKVEAILHSAGDAIAMGDMAMQIQYVNPAFVTLTGYTDAEALGQPLDALIGALMSEQDRQSLKLASDQGRGWQGEITIQRKDGRHYEAAMIVSPIHDAEGHLLGYVSSHQDISRFKALDQARRQFITSVSHELRTPVTTLDLYAHLLRQRNQSEENLHYIKAIEDQVSQLINLIKDILEITALDSGQAVRTWETVSLSYLIGNTMTCYQSRAEAAGLTLVAPPLTSDMPVVKGDPGRLAQMLGEIVENAITFTTAGGQVTLDIGTAEDANRTWVVIAIRDTGPGISPEEQEKVFDRFFRGSLAESGHLAGAGLGLSIAREIAVAHGGRLTVSSALGAGATFTVWLPLADR